eukprot:scaffold1754_cov33-Phaeocystis_antarctica.AAC.1
MRRRSAPSQRRPWAGPRTPQRARTLDWQSPGGTLDEQRGSQAGLLLTRVRLALDRPDDAGP